MIDVINNLDKVLIYYVPGFIFYTLFNFLHSKNIEIESNIPINCSISFLLVTLSRYVLTKFDIPYNSIKLGTLSILLSFLLVFILFKCTTKNTKLNSIMIKYFFKTLRNIWDDTIDLKNGSNLKIFIKDEKYFIQGVFRRYGNDWIVLDNFVKKNEADGEICYNAIDYTQISEKVSIMIPFSEIQHIEVF